MPKKYKPGQELKGWEIKRVHELKDLQINFIELEHKITKARYVHLANKDEESVFAVAFRTIPEDSSGVAHILEHSVLAGSRNYPVRDPFFSMIKRSLCTFMNAFTSADWTAYPFATKNKKDFFNLLGVYLDAAFFPLLDEKTFMQEGVRLDFAGKDLVYKGVVYNEMKGVMSSPERVMEEAQLRALFPRSAYRFNSGGDPKIIPKLNLKKLKDFHARYYHPSNAIFYSYGALLPEEILDFINQKVLNHYDGALLPVLPEAEADFKKPRRLICPYPYSGKGSGAKKYQAALAFRLADITEFEEVFMLELIEDLLIASPAAPLRKALFASGLGSDLADGSGLDCDLRQTVFACGLKDIRKTDIVKMSAIIRSQFAYLAKNGFANDTVSASLAKIELAHKEVAGRPYPYGLKLYLRLIETGVWKGDMLSAIDFSAIIGNVRRKLKDQKYLKRKIKEYFIDNNNHALVILEPDKNLQKEIEKAERKQLQKIQKRLSGQRAAQIKKAAAELDELQEKGEDLSVLPSLKIEDIPKKTKHITGLKIENNGELFNYEISGNGVYYFTGFIPLPKLEREELMLIPLLSYLLPLLGTGSKNYEELAKAINLSSGGIMFSEQALNCHTTGKMQAGLSVFGRCLDRQINDLHSVMREIISDFSFSDLSVLRKFIFEYNARQQSNIIDDASRLAMSFASAGLSETAQINELWNGITQIKYTDNLCRGLSERKLRILSNQLEELGRKIISVSKPLLLQAGNKAVLKSGRKAIRDLSKCFIEKKPDKMNNFKLSQTVKTKNDSIRHGFFTSSSVSFVGASLKAVKFGHTDAPVLTVLGYLLARKFFHKEIREKGGAYGGGVRYNNREGVFSLYSFRDPHIISTLKVFERARGFILSGDYSRGDVFEAIIQSISELDRLNSPFDKAMSDFQRRLSGIGETENQKYREALLRVNINDLRRAAQKYLPPDFGKSRITVISFKEKLKKSNCELGENGLILEKIV